ncbi:MAG: DMT family transporter [Desulfobacterales bacterium]|nr:DMT family transporter [Desulfobacterales bacterium]
MTNNVPSNDKLTIWTAAQIILITFIFGSSSVVIKISMFGFGPFTALAIRSVIALIAILVWAIATHRPLKLKKGQFPQVMFIALLSFIEMSMYFIGFSKTDASRGSLLMNIQPFFILLLAHFFIPGDRITLKKTMGILFGFLGVLFIFMENRGVSSDLMVGDILIIIGVLCWAVNAIFVKLRIHNFEPFHLVMYSLLLGIPAFSLQAFIFDSRMVGEITVASVSALFYLGIITVGFGYVAWTKIMQKIGTTTLHAFVFLIPVSGVLSGALVLGEPLTYKIVLALIFIVAGIMVVQLQKPDDTDSKQLKKI